MNRLSGRKSKKVSLLFMGLGMMCLMNCSLPKGGQYRPEVLRTIMYDDGEGEWMEDVDYEDKGYEESDDELEFDPREPECSMLSRNDEAKRDTTKRVRKK